MVDRSIWSEMMSPVFVSDMNYVIVNSISHCAILNKNHIKISYSVFFVILSARLVSRTSVSASPYPSVGYRDDPALYPLGI